jgi:hypothetical protein
VALKSIRFIRHSLPAQGRRQCRIGREKKAVLARPADRSASTRRDERADATIGAHWRDGKVEVGKGHAGHVLDCFGKAVPGFAGAAISIRSGRARHTLGRRGPFQLVH